MRKRFNGWYVVAVLFIVFASMIFFNGKSREEALKKSLKTYGIIIMKPTSGAKSPLSIKYQYKNQKGQHIIISKGVQKDECPLVEGDTIYIRYSLTDNSVAEIIHCYWNDKLRIDMENQ